MQHKIVQVLLAMTHFLSTILSKPSPRGLTCYLRVNFKMPKALYFEVKDQNLTKPKFEVK